MIQKSAADDRGFEPLTWQKPNQDELRSRLTPLQFKVTQENGTERSFSDPLHQNKEDGLYVDIVSGEPLFTSLDKFDSGTGWPSFAKPIFSEAVTEHEDRYLFMKRTEVRSRYADSHLGHVFPDGPKSLGGLRYCLNGAALRFIPKGQLESAGYGSFLNLFSEN